MNCPNCLSLMYNKDEIHKQGEYARMNLHCDNNCTPGYSQWMQVLAKPNETWISNAYGFIFDGYCLEGNKPGNWTKVSKCMGVQEITILPYGFVEPKTTIKSYINIQLISTEYYNLSTGNDLHIKAKELVDNLIYLA